MRSIYKEQAISNVIDHTKGTVHRDLGECGCDLIYSHESRNEEFARKRERMYRGVIISRSPEVG